MNQKFQEFLNIFGKLTINIPYPKTLGQMPNYAMFIKQILSNKTMSEEFETMALNEECNAVLQMKLPPKLMDIGSFILSPLGQNFHPKYCVI